MATPNYHWMQIRKISFLLTIIQITICNTLNKKLSTTHCSNILQKFLHKKIQMTRGKSQRCYCYVGHRYHS